MSEVTRKTLGVDVRAVRERVLQFVISTSDADRDNDTIDASGWELGAYRKNPVVLFGHDSKSLPVARALAVRVEDGRLVADAEFAPASIYPFADTVYQMLKAGFLRATSVGFRALEWVRNEARGGIDFKRQELLEFSVVPVPANPGALMVGRGADAHAVKAWLAGGHGDEPVIEILDDEIVEFDERDFKPALRAAMAEAFARTRSHRLNAARLSGMLGEPAFEVDPYDLAREVGAVVRAALRDVAADATTRALNKLRGRLD